MNLFALLRKTRKISHEENSDNPHLREPWLMLARLGWLAIAILTLLTFAASLPALLTQFRTLCTEAACVSGQLSSGSAQELAHLHLSVSNYAILSVVFLVMAALVNFSLALVIAWHRSDDLIGLLVSLMLIELGTFNMVNVFTSSPSPWQIPAQSLNYIGFVLFFLVFSLFPNGRFAPRWSRWLLAGVAIAEIITFLPDSFELLQILAIPVLACFMLGLGGAQIYRYRRVSDQVQRQQTKWVCFSVVITILGQVGLVLPYLFLPNLNSSLYGAFHPVLSSIATVFIPLAFSFAILHYRLWDIDLIINRTLVYGILTASIVGIYALTVSSLSALLQTQGNPIVSLVAAGFIAVLFQPIRERLQRLINRLIYGERDEPYRVISRLGQRMEATLAPDAVLSVIVETVAQALKLPYAAITWKRGSTFPIAASYGTAGKPVFSVPLTYQTEQIGELQLVPRARDESLTPADRRLLDDLARQIGVAVHAVRLTADLQLSRERLVTAREEERRRLRRDLHDGLGPALASITLKLDAARNLLVRDPSAADALLVDLKKQTQTALTDIRRLVYELRPPSLDELGLLSALREQAEQYISDGLQITIDAPEPLPALPAAVEVATYRIVQEALTNVVRHAQAHSCIVRFTLGHSLKVEVRDDGRGIAAGQRAGVGLTSIRERAAELGGTCEIETAPTSGTRLYVQLPLAKE